MTAARIDHKTTCALNATGHRGPCTCGAESSAAQMGDEACTRCGAIPETGQGEDCPECQGIVGPLRLSYGGIFPDVEERYKKLRGETT